MTRIPDKSIDTRKKYGKEPFLSIYWLIPAVLLVIVLLGLPYRFDVTEVSVSSPKITSAVKIAVVSDLHDTGYGKDSCRLIAAVKEQKPDLILIPGDLFSDGVTSRYALPLLKGLQEYPICFSAGNHEVHTGRLQDIYEELEDAGVHVLDQSACTLRIQDQVIELAGIADRKNQECYAETDIQNLFHSRGYRILLCHRPNWDKVYAAAQCDLIVSGHAHGGHWRLPLVRKGVFAPQQGFMPADTQGLKKLDHKYQFISRGLVRQSYGIVRLYNNPEIGIIRLMPQKEKNRC